MIQTERILVLNDHDIRNRSFVLYWMQAAQRAEWNHALDYAIKQANTLEKPVVAAFSVTDDFPEANERHYAFMLEGLKETQAALAKRGIQLVILHGSPEKNIPAIAQNADLLVTDEGYLRIQQQWRHSIAETVDCKMVEVTTNLIVPIEEVSDKENYSAGTLRPRIHRQLDKYLVPLRHIKPKCSSVDSRLRGNDKEAGNDKGAVGDKEAVGDIEAGGDKEVGDDKGGHLKSFDISETQKALEKLAINRTVKASPCFTGGTSQAKKRLRHFIKHTLDDYPDKRNDPMLDCQSNLSPYLHFGQISPLAIALEIMKTDSPGKDAFLEELIVRRELAYNFVYYNQRYDDFDALPPWALRTLNFHAKDKRDYIYTREQFETAQTHDPYWNAAQTEMVLTGKMHNYMRMYWGKKILEWSDSPKNAFQIAIYLNNKYELDGRDPNGYAGVAWCFGKHDRAWNRRPVFGTVRYMNASGLKRKFNPDAYVHKIQNLRETLS